ncbi:MAG: IclR family transcriptional regulator [Nocardioidaceae bacterium]
MQSVERALDLLEALATAEQPLGVTALARQTGLPIGTIHRLLSTLLQRGFVRQDGSRAYAPGPSLFRVGQRNVRRWAAPAGPYLARLVEVSGETANLAVLEGDYIVYVAQVPSPHRLRMFAEVGRHVTAHSTAVGKVLLADLPPASVQGVVRRVGLPTHTPRTISAVPDLMRELDKVRADGWAMDAEEEELGVRCVAVPVREAGRVVASLSVSGPAARFDSVELGALVEQMQDVADDFAAEAFGA